MTDIPSMQPTDKPVTDSPTIVPSKSPVTESPTMLPSKRPVTDSPTLQPIDKPILVEENSDVQNEGTDQLLELELSLPINIDNIPSSESSEDYGKILDEDINAYLDLEFSLPMNFPMVEVPTPTPTTGTKEGVSRGEVISNELKTVNDDPVASNQLWVISVMFGAGLLLIALYVFQSRQRIASNNELNADEVSVSDDLLLSYIIALHTSDT